MNEVCYCGSESFWVRKKNHQFMVVCQGCKCERRMTTPGISVGMEGYQFSVPFKERS
jgi:hypothetical protein